MKNITSAVLVFVITTLLPFPAMALDGVYFPGSKNLKRWMTQLLEEEKDQSRERVDGMIPSVLKFYQQVGYRPTWTGPDGLLANGELLMETIAKSSTVGLDRKDYLPTDIEKTWVGIVHKPNIDLNQTIAPYIRQDVILTEQILRYANHIHQGKVMPEEIYPSWQGVRRETHRDLPKELAQAVKHNRLKAFIESLHPQSKRYRHLRNALEGYERIRQHGEWFPIKTGSTLRPGDRGPRVAMLKYRLKVTGDGFNDGPIANDVFDEMTIAAVKQFQHRHGLKEDGLVGKKTLAELNIPLEKRIEQLQLNLERLRWFPDSFGDCYLLVNIPAFELTVARSGNRIDKMRVIVGKKKSQTPVMSDQMTYVEINPYWNVPHKIAARDILPRIKKDPSYFLKQGIRIFDSWEANARELDPLSIDWSGINRHTFHYRLRQDPSSKNALGQIKFIFPNPHSVYIHDTPRKSLFNRQIRAFSHGCVRLENPMTLAYNLLSDQGWDRERIAATTDKKQPSAVTLTPPMPVHLVYFTAWVDEDQKVNFREDIYGRDAYLDQALQHQPSGQRL